MSQFNHKYQVRMNAPKPSEEKVKEHKDFTRLLKQYKRAKRPRPLHSVLGKVNRLMPLVIIVLSLLVLLMFYIQFAKQQKKQDEPKGKVEQVDGGSVSDGGEMGLYACYLQGHE